MLKHHTLGPTADGSYLVVYPTPGCAIPTTVCNCSTKAQAREESRRLNKQQRKQAKAEQRARKAIDRRAGLN